MSAYRSSTVAPNSTESEFDACDLPLVLTIESWLTGLGLDPKAHADAQNEPDRMVWSFKEECGISVVIALYLDEDTGSNYLFIETALNRIPENQEISTELLLWLSDYMSGLRTPYRFVVCPSRRIVLCQYRSFTKGLSRVYAHELLREVWALTINTQKKLIGKFGLDPF